MDQLHSAIDEAGGQSAIARLLGVSPAAVSQWVSGHRPIPIRHCAQIEALTKGAVSRKDLRPDDWQKIWPELVAPVEVSHG